MRRTLFRLSALLATALACNPPPPRVAGKSQDTGLAYPEPAAPARDQPAPTASTTHQTTAGPSRDPSLSASPTKTIDAPVLPEPEPEPLQYPFHQPLPSVAERSQGPASRFANLSPLDCRKRLAQADLPFERVGGPAKGIATPLRFTGPLGEVDFRVPPKSVSFGMLDCRLALTWAELVPLLREHEVAEIRIDNFYRRNARLPRRRSRSQHAYGLASDVVSFRLEDGRLLDIENDWHGERGRPPCGPDAAVRPPSDEAIRLRNLVCALARAGAFHHILTPSYDAAHRNHLHLDIKRDEKWFGVR